MGSLTAQQRLTVMLELLGGPNYARQMKAASASTAQLGKTTKATGAEMAVGSRRTFLMNQGLYTLRRYAFYGTLALTGMTVAVAKLGYNYLSALQNARVALSPVIKDTARLNSYLNQLFQISKYSPFVITNMAIAFRTMYAQMSHIGIGGQTIVNVLKAVSDYLSFTGHTTPADMNRVSGALAKMANLGRLTGRTILQLAAGGIPIYDILNKKLGITRDQLSKISSLNIPPSSVLAAILSYARTDKGVRGAAQRLSLHSFSGLLQVGKDTISQLSGNLIKGSYSGGQGFLGRLLGPNGSLNKIANFSGNHTASQTITQISRSLTGGSGLGKGFLLLLDITKQFARVVAHVMVPALAIAAHSLIIFWPLLKLLDITFKFAADHGKIFKWVLSILAAEFIIAHTNILLFGGGMKLFSFLTFGSVRPLIQLIKYIKLLRTVELAGAIKRLTEYATATQIAGSTTTNFGLKFKNNTLLAGFIRQIIKTIGWLKKLREAMIGAGFLSALGSIASAVPPLAVIAAGAYGYSQVNTHSTGIGVTGGTLIHPDNSNSYLLRRYNANRGPTRPIPVTPTIIHTHVYIDGKEVANSVDKVKAAKRARK